MSFVVEGATGTWEIVCGLEVHAQVTSRSKLFSGAATAYGATANTQVSPVDAGMPGMLPVVNGWCVEQAVRTGLGLRAQINRSSVFERKNYFYPDLPCGYQISQYQHPIVGTGKLTIDFPDGTAKDIGITRLHLEMDAGKSLHESHADASLIDLNRSGVALMEIVSEPDIRTPEEAVLYLRKLRSILRYLETCDGNMEEGSLRCDANVSVRRVGDETLGTRCEVKNVNSMRFVARAIEYEAKRQVEVLEAGGRIDQETRLFDSAQGRDALDALQGGSARLSLLSRPRSAATGVGGSADRADLGEPARIARRQEGALRPGLWAIVVRRGRAGGGGGDRRLFRDGGRRSRCQAGGELGQQRAVRSPGQGRQGHRGQSGRCCEPGQALGSAQVRGDQRPDRQGRVRDHVRDRAATPRPSSRSGGSVRSPIPAPSRRCSTS